MESPSASGFVVLDDRAQIMMLAEVGGDGGGAVRVAQTLEEMRLDGGGGGGLSGGVMELDMQEDADGDDDDIEGESVSLAHAMEVDAADAAPEGTMDVDADEGEDAAHAAVFARDALAAVFDAPTAIASGGMGAVEDLFARVVGLVAGTKV
jgi:hypothetical protein